MNLEKRSQIITIILSIIATIISIYNLFSYKEDKKRNFGQSEIEVRNMINSSQMHFEEIIYNKLGKKLTNDEEEEYQLLIKSSKERVKNVYEEACMKYLDGKVDKVRFKKTYNREIRQLVEENQEDYKEVKNIYEATLKVYKEWNNKEN